MHPYSYWNHGISVFDGLCHWDVLYGECGVMKHTKGPWIPSTHGFQVLTDDSLHSICELKQLPDMKGNSRLIAAAPELLHALQNLVEYLDEHDWGLVPSG